MISFSDILVLLLSLACAYMGVQIFRDFFGPKMQPNHYATPGDHSVRLNRRREMRRKKTNELILFVMILFALAGVLVYFRSP